jgi:hypothetical protein
MKCSTKYVGLDVHQATTVATVRESSGKIIARSILPTEDAALLEFFAGMRGAVHVAFEERHAGAVAARVQRRAAQRTVRCNSLLAAHAPVVHSDCAVAERRRRDQLEPSRAG